jgi:hypothetical protein
MIGEESDLRLRCRADTVPCDGSAWLLQADLTEDEAKRLKHYQFLGKGSKDVKDPYCASSYRDMAAFVDRLQAAWPEHKDKVETYVPTSWYLYRHIFEYDSADCSYPRALPLRRRTPRPRGSTAGHASSHPSRARTDHLHLHSHEQHRQ